MELYENSEIAGCESEVSFMKKVIGYIPGEFSEERCLAKILEAEKCANRHGYFLTVLYPGLKWYEADAAWKLDFLAGVGLNSVEALIIDDEFVMDDSKVLSFTGDLWSKGKAVVLLESDTETYPAVSFDYHNAYLELIHHLTKEHNCTRIAAVGNSSEDKKFTYLMDAYKEGLENAGISFTDDFVISDFNSINRRNPAFVEFYRRVNPQAIMCANDSVAADVIDSLRIMGDGEASKCIVTGMGGVNVDDFRYRRITTGVRDIPAMMEKAFCLVDDSLNGNVVSMNHRIKCEPVFSESCGCIEPGTLGVSPEYADLLSWKLESISKVEDRQFIMGEALKNVEGADELSAVMQDEIPDNSCLFLTKSIMRKYFNLCGEDYGDRKEGAHVIADKLFQRLQGTGVSQKSFLQEFIDNPNNSAPLFVFTASGGHSLYGFLAFSSPDYAFRLFMMKSFMTNLCSHISQHIRSKELSGANRELAENYSNIKKMQIRDAMTGLYNSKGFAQELEHLKEHCLETKENIWFICADLDRLGNINEIYGHSEGDEAIQTLAQIVTACANRDEICARIGSDEFVVALHNGADGERAVSNFLSNLTGRLENYNLLSGKDYSLQINTSSYMTVVFPETVMKEAVDAAFSNKRIIKNNRRNNIAEDEEGLLKINPVEARLVKDIIDNNRFKYAFQPIVDAKTGEICAYEALMRSDTSEPVSPATILKYAKFDRRLYDIERATFFNVLETVTNNIDKISGKKVFVNSIPGHQMDATDYELLKKDYIHHFNRLVVEITEQTELDDEGLNLMLSRSGSEGFEVAIDDYGCGYSNMVSLLKYLPNCVKVDRLLITEIQEDPRKQHFVKNIIEFAHDNGFKVLAEGVETSAELKAVIHMGVDLIQGFYTARPSFEIIQELPEHIKNEILDVNYNPNDKLLKKVYIVNREQEISLMGIALEKYTGILISQPEVTIHGNPNFVAGVRIKIKENSNCRVRLKNVRIESDDELSCIEIGKNTKLTLMVEGKNEFRNGGIHVPEGSSVCIEGDGDLSIVNKKKQCFGIGADYTKKFGSIEIAVNGTLDINLDGENCIGIGGGIGTESSLVRTVGDNMKVNIVCVGSDCVGIGSMKGKAPIDLSGGSVKVSFDCQNGVGVGSFEGEQKTGIARMRLAVSATGNEVAALGCKGEAKGAIEIMSSKVRVDITASEGIMFGSRTGNIKLCSEDSKISLFGTGSNILGIGSRTGNGSILFKKTTFEGLISSQNPVKMSADFENAMLDEVTDEVRVEKML